MVRPAFERRTVRLASDGAFLEAARRRSLSIRVAGNTMTPCLQVIVSKGYTVAHYVDRTAGERELPFWDAEKDGRCFSATGVEELLGLISMWEQRGDDWRPKPGEGEILDNLLNTDVGGPTDTSIDLAKGRLR